MKMLAKDNIKINTQYSDTVWDQSSGLSLQELEAGCRRIESDMLDDSYQKIKTRQMAYILANARLEKNPDDIFADKLCGSGIINRLRSERHKKIGETFMKEQLRSAGKLISDRAIEVETDFGHLAPDWEFLFKNGVPGVLDALRKAASGVTDEGRREFFDCSIEIWEAVRGFMSRLAAHKRAEGSDFCAGNLEALTLGAPSTLAEAMQLTFTVYNLETNLEQATVRSLGRLDRFYYPLYKNDLASGRFTESELRILTENLLCKIHAMKITANLPIAICGMEPDGGDSSNDYTKIILEEYDRLDIDDPKFHVFYHDSVRPDILRMMLDMIRRGRNSFVFINSGVVAKSLARIGISEPDARDFIIYGCYEAASAGREIPATCGGRINLPKAVEYTLAAGDGFADFGAFMREVKRNIGYMIEKCMETLCAWEKYYDRICPAPMLSGTYANCRETGTDVFCGGAKYNNTSIVVSCTASLVDMVAAVKTAVFDKKLTTLDNLRKALAANWEGYQTLRHFCADECPKYGCNDEEADSIAVELCEYICSLINGKPNGRGGVFRCGMFSIDWRFRFGKALGATPDGRFAGEQLSKNFCACLGKDKHGVTALINSASKIDCTQIPDGAVLDLVLHPTAVRGDEGITAMQGLLHAYMKQGGFSVQFNVLDADILRKAQREPDRYRNLQVRLCGWNVYFVNLSKAEQDEFIHQAESAG